MTLRDRLRAVFEVGQHPLTPRPERGRQLPGSRFGEVSFATSGGEAVRGFFSKPRTTSQAPAILYVHAHGDRYDIGAREVLDGRPALQGPLGETLVDMGFAVLCIDLPGFGGRAGEPESALAKAALWQGGSLAGQMLGELSSAFDWLSAQEGIDPHRVGLFGISMGATLGYWLAAVDPRVAAVAHLCCFADFEQLIACGAHDRHGIYLTVPGLLKLASNGDIAALIAPRPQCVGIGDQDPLTPPTAVDPALARLHAAYEACSDKLQVIRSPDTGHVETPEMRRALLDFLARI
ncbi:MAG: CocE/NonD family hydrolase [Pseudomonadota bacterium]